MWQPVQRLAAAAPVEPAETPVPRETLDPSVLQTLREWAPVGGPDPVLDLMAAFLTEAAERLDTMRTAVSGGDGVKLRAAAHSLKGMCGAIGANHMSDLSSALEHAEVGTLNLDGMEQLELEFRRVQQALREAT